MAYDDVDDRERESGGPLPALLGGAAGAGLGYGAVRYANRPPEAAAGAASNASSPAATAGQPSPTRGTASERMADALAHEQQTFDGAVTDLRKRLVDQKKQEFIAGEKQHFLNSTRGQPTETVFDEAKVAQHFDEKIKGSWEANFDNPSHAFGNAEKEVERAVHMPATTRRNELIAPRATEATRIGLDDRLAHRMERLGPTRDGQWVGKDGRQAYDRSVGAHHDYASAHKQYHKADAKFRKKLTTLERQLETATRTGNHAMVAGTQARIEGLRAAWEPTLTGLRTDLENHAINYAMAVEHNPHFVPHAGTAQAVAHTATSGAQSLAHEAGEAAAHVPAVGRWGKVAIIAGLGGLGMWAAHRLAQGGGDRSATPHQDRELARRLALQQMALQSGQGFGPSA